MLLHGIFPPITTPFYPDGRVYLKKLEHNLERYSKTPVAGIVVLGSSGEAIMLSDDERREVLKTARQACAPQKVLIAGTGAESAIETLRLTEYAAELGYDVALVRTPHFYRPQMQPANLLAFYRTIADRSPIPILIYSVPVFTNYDMPADLVIELAEHPNIIGIKESGGDIEKIRRIAEATRQIKRGATVTETFGAVTARMIRAAQAEKVRGQGEMVPVGALAYQSSTSSAKAGTPSASSTARLEAAPFQSSSEASISETVRETAHETARVGEALRARPAEQSSAMNQANAQIGVECRSSSGSSVPSSSSLNVIGNLKTRQKEVGFQVLAGQAQKLHASLVAGAVGAVLAFADPAPTACYEIYAAWKESDANLAQLKQDRISTAATKVAGQFGIPALKYAMDLNGYYGGPPRSPLLPLTADLRSEVERLMADIRN